ncbi:MAG: purine-nucleoside phosphorylase [Firmicutes bacterium]|nr:purine-nucleoside phosphorylase [Bacillota bacterium]
MKMERIDGAAKAIEAACGGAEVGLILGSGLGNSFASLDVHGVLSYKDIPGFPIPTVPGHNGEWVCGSLHGKRVAVMRGRFHYYEGYDIEEVVLPVRVMLRLGVKTLIVTNAAGGVNTGFVPGDLMLIRDTINYSGVNPLIGPNDNAFGPRFPDMSRQFDPALCEVARAYARELRITLREGVYMWFSGPSFETPAEIRMARALGADAVGMSTVPEVIVARHGGMRVLGISCITNMAAGILDQPLNHQEVLDTGERVRKAFAGLVDGVVRGM